MNRPALISGDSLTGIELFSDLERDPRHTIAARLTGQRYGPGQIIVTQDDSANDVFFIVSGTVRVGFHAESGKDVQFRDMHAGDTFGELSAIDGRPRSAEVQALDEVFLAKVSAEDFIEIVTSNPPLAQRLLKQLTLRVRSLSDRVVEFSTLGVSNRIHGELLRLARETGETGNRILVKPSPTHADIAARVSTHREAVTRELATLAKSGIVKRGRGSLEILDVGRLEALVRDVAGH